MMKKIKELTNSTTAKVIASIVIPGGFIVWGGYELAKYIKKKTNKEENDES